MVPQSSTFDRRFRVRARPRRVKRCRTLLPEGLMRPFMVGLVNEAIEASLLSIECRLRRPRRLPIPNAIVRFQVGNRTFIRQTNGAGCFFVSTMTDPRKYQCRLTTSGANNARTVSVTRVCSWASVSRRCASAGRPFSRWVRQTSLVTAAVGSLQRVKWPFRPTPSEQPATWVSESGCRHARGSRRSFSGVRLRSRIDGGTFLF